ncbi:MAG: hypothetical protein KDC98_10660 [Planctomycetes bacterium]|nr:hypothetical protein [Planctomycetota bacterium]
MAADIALMIGPGLDARESAMALGLAHVLETLGLRVVRDAGSAQLHGQGRARLSILCSAIKGLDANLRRAEGSTIVLHPLVRNRSELGEWLARRDRVHGFLAASHALGERLAAGGAKVEWIGSSCQIGTVRHQSRLARGLRDEDRVFTVCVDERSPNAASAALRKTWDRRARDHATRFAKVSLVVNVTTDRLYADWDAWARQSDAASIVVERSNDDPLALMALLEMSDAMFVTGAVVLGRELGEPDSGAGCADLWPATHALFHRKPVIVLGSLPPAAFGLDDPAHLYRVADADPRRIDAAVARVVAGAREDRDAWSAGARQMMQHASARATAVRVTEALRSMQLWDAITAGAGS